MNKPKHHSFVIMLLSMLLVAFVFLYKSTGGDKNSVEHNNEGEIRDKITERLAVSNEDKDNHEDKGDSLPITPASQIDYNSFSREDFEGKVYYTKFRVLDLLQDFEKLEPGNGIVTHRHPDGSKNSVDIYDDDNILIGKLVYLTDDWIHQLVEWENGKQHGITAFLSISGDPHMIFTFNNSKLHGPFYEFATDGPNRGSLLSYVEFVDNYYKGYCLAWSPDGIPHENCRYIDEPMPAPGLQCLGEE